MKEGKQFHANCNQMKAGVTIPTSCEIDFKSKTVSRGKDGTYIVMKGLTQQDNMKSIYMHAPNNGLPRQHSGKESTCQCKR